VLIVLINLHKISWYRNWDPVHWRYNVLTPKQRRVTVSQRNHYNFHDGSPVTVGQYGKTGKSEFPHRRTTGLFRSSQWGSATIPYKGAKVNVPVLSGSKKVSYKAVL